MARRVAGVLAHPTSLPGPPGIGDLGPACAAFVDWIAEAGLGLWQVLPLGPVGPGHSPYSSPSAFAGNPLLVSPERLVEAGWLDAATLPRGRSTEHVDWGRALDVKRRLLHEAHAGFDRRADAADRAALEAFATAPAQRFWLDDWTLFAALARRACSSDWASWSPDLRDRSTVALAAAREELADDIAHERFRQFLFFRQWSAAHRAARERQIEILGDVPFYVAHDSADVWSHREVFRLGASGRPAEVAGVPPDYFSEDGQLWGNPLFDWQHLAAHGYDWWVRRLEANLRLADRVRIDHFRAFESFWVVPATAATAKDGHWEKGPGAPFFETLRGRLGGLPFVAEDLGDITPEVLTLRDRFGLPGMRILQFGLLDETSEHHPVKHVPASVVYTGTHDNDTLRGWLESLSPEDRARLAGDGAAEPTAWSIVERAFHSPAETVIVPLQDLLGLGGEARMNLPGVGDGNWGWRAADGALAPDLARRVRRLAESSGRA